jgi:AraC-like DNA-binding protein
MLQAIGADFVLSLVVDMCRMNYGASLRPVEVRLCRKRPANAEPWKNFYGCPVHFDDRENSILLSPRVASEVLPTANRQPAGTLDSILVGQLAAPDRSNIPARCKATLLEQITSGELSEQSMAKTLHMSRRTLQRKLAEAELSYQKLVDDTRHELALRYLEDPQKSVIEVTFLLGFSGQSAFSRAFRRWTGVSPTEYRARKLRQDSVMTDDLLMTDD